MTDQVLYISLDGDLDVDFEGYFISCIKFQIQIQTEIEIKFH